MIRENLLGARLVEAERKRERITARAGNAEEFTNCRYVRFAIHAVKSLGDVEHEIWLRGAEALRKIGCCL